MYSMDAHRFMRIILTLKVFEVAALNYKHLVAANANLGNIEMGRGHRDGAGPALPPEDFEVLRSDLEHLGLTASAMSLARVRATYANFTFADFASVEPFHFALDELTHRVTDELKGKFVHYMAPSRFRYYVDLQLFGPLVPEVFPKAIDDIEGAGKTLACEQGTACVLHLMRVMEAGLKALAKPLGISYAPSWESYLTQIQNKIGARHKTKTVKWKRDEAFFRDVSGDLISVKQAWRNPTMHVVRKYSADEAEEIFVAVRTFMKRLAEGLPKPSLKASSPGRSS